MSARPLRVAHVTTVDMSLALLLATELRVDVEAGFDTFGLSAPGPYVPKVEALGVRHVPVASLTRTWDLRRDLAAAWELYRALRNLDLDVLHTHTHKAGFLGRIAGRAAGVPVVVNTCHGLWARPDDRLARRALVYAAEAFAAQFSHAELYQNDSDRQTLRRVVPAARALTVGNGIDLTRFRHDPVGRQRLRSEFGIGDGEVLVVGVGRRVAEKGIREFAEAARALAPRARFVWAGPADADKADHLVDDEQGVEFIGYRDDMPAVYSALDVFVLPSYREGFSRSAMEAAACGCALVLSDIRGCREIGVHGEHALFAPAADPRRLTAAIGQLLDDPSLRSRLAVNAATRARHEFDQRRVAATSLAVYDLVARRRGLRWAGPAP